ncbi:MAG: AgmX/PglI C-terminal domain-containing protein [Myxococcales bacterium]|nr:AgmX/PglI C-terminal domain-containing protein [Myxococcales bacterium]
MRFECDSCHAKYKISDEKVRGRVVRFPCRKCNHKILIDGRKGDPDVTVPAGAAYGFDDVTRKSEPVSAFGHEAPTARARRQSSPIRRRNSSMPPRPASSASRSLSSAPAAASAALPGHHPGLAFPVPVAPTAGTAEVPEWHVSINDVPVGPIRLEEMAHKIDASAVSEYTLVWREGFDEWRPLATVPELMALLHERRHSGPPSRSSFSSMPPFVDSRTSTTESEMPAVVSSPPSPPSPPLAPAGAVPQNAPVDFAPLADALQPESGSRDSLGEMSQPPAPLGPADVFQSSPQLGSYSGLPPEPDDLVSVPSVPPPAAVAEAEPDKRVSLGKWAVIVAVVVFSSVAAFLAFDRFGDSLLKDLLGKLEPVAAVPAASTPVVQKAAEEPSELAAEEPPSEDDAVQSLPAEGESVDGESVDGESVEGDQVAAVDAVLAVEPVIPADDGPKMAPARPRKPKARRAPRPKPAVAPAPSDSLSDADQKLLADFDSSVDAAPAKIAVEKSGATQSNKPPLDGDGVRATVTTNKPRLQRCYERSIRGQQSSPSVRLDVTVTVAASGRVKAVNAVGTGPGGLAACVEASVRRWRFPASSEGGPAKFPIVFSAN